MAAVLIVAHAPLASALQAVAAHVYCDGQRVIEALDVGPGATPESARDEALALMARHSDAEWLVLTDVFGATPCNAAQLLNDAPADARPGPMADPLLVRVVTGVNVPMLWRSLCYFDESLDNLVTRAVGGGTQGIVQASPTRPQNQGVSAPSRDPVDHHHQQ